MVRGPRYGWELQAQTWCVALERMGEWRGSRAAVLQEAEKAMAGASMAFLRVLKAKGWRTPEALVHGWAHARHWEVFEDAAADVLVLRRKPRKPAPGRKAPPPAQEGPGLFGGVDT